MSNTHIGHLSFPAVIAWLCCLIMLACTTGNAMAEGQQEAGDLFEKLKVDRLTSETKAGPVFEKKEKIAGKLDKIERQAVQQPEDFVSDSARDKFLLKREEHRFYLLLILMVVTVLVVGMVSHFFTRRGHSCENLLSAVGLVLVIQATSFIVVAAHTSEQLTTAIGVLGAIAGYLFGSAARPGSSMGGRPAVGDDARQ